MSSQYTIKAKVESSNEDFVETIEKLMRFYCSSVRYAFNRIKYGYPSNISNDKRELRKSLYKIEQRTLADLQNMFIPNYRYCKWAYEEALWIYKSQKKLLPLYVFDLNKKIAKSEQKKRKYIECRVESLKGRSKTEIISAIEKRIDRLVEKRRQYQEHMVKGTIPNVIFGGRKNFFKIQNGILSNQDWKKIRSNHLYSRGQANKKGNANTRLKHVSENKFELSILIPGAKEKSKSRVTAKILVTPRDVDLLKAWIELAQQEMKGHAYSVRIMRKKGQFYVHITLKLPIVKPGEVLRNGEKKSGIDVNPARIDVAVIDSDGNYLDSETFHMPAVEHARHDKRKDIIGKTIKKVFDFVQTHNCDTVTIEKLKFDQSHDTNKIFNRMSHNFAKEEILSTIETSCHKLELLLRSENPAFSSIIGRWKYKETYGLCDHQSAALVLARRGIGLQEKIPLFLANVIPNLRSGATSWIAWGKVKRFLDKIRKHATKKKIACKGWLLSDYLSYHHHKMMVEAFGLAIQPLRRATGDGSMGMERPKVGEVTPHSGMDW